MSSLNLTFTLSHKKQHQLEVEKQRKRIQKIINVYQLQYKNGNIFGFGDFIRGCFCLLQLCKKLGLQFDIDVSNHPISNYFEGHVKKGSILYNKIYKFDDSPYCCKTFMRSLQRVHSETYYTCINMFPMFEIKQSEIDLIREKLQPNAEMKRDIEQEMIELQLSSKQFSVIHIRSGDQFLLQGGNINESWSGKMFSLLTPILENKSTTFLILSDNNQLKLLFKKYTNCIVQIKPITHLGIGNMNNENIKNTMMDFYLMSQSKEIYSISTYGHGTGFSKWSSVLNNIPYKIITISTASIPENIIKMKIF